jgi:monoterpene epsilon-lactone hydrolase
MLDIRPNDWKDNRKVLVYTHGGAYTLFSARSTLISSAVMSRATGLRVISVDYTNPPFARWGEIQEQVISVFMALLVEGYTMKDIALYGDSAGGGLATNTVLNLRDRGMGMPASVVLWSPWVDLTNAGDTANTLANTDPILHYDPVLKNSALAFADHWGSGDDSFQSNPPNATLSIVSGDLPQEIVLVLKSPRFENNV